LDARRGGRGCQKRLQHFRAESPGILRGPAWVEMMPVAKIRVRAPTARIRSWNSPIYAEPAECIVNTATHGVRIFLAKLLCLGHVQQQSANVALATQSQRFIHRPSRDVAFSERPQCVL